MHKLDQLLADASATEARPAALRAEIAKLEAERVTLDAIAEPSDKELARIAALDVLLKKHVKALAALDPSADAFAVLNSPRGAAVLGDLLSATRKGLDALERERMASALKLFAALGKRDTAALRAEDFYTAADSAAELWEDVGNARAAIASAAGLVSVVSTARPGSAWHFAAVLEILRPAAVLTRAL